MSRIIVLLIIAVAVGVSGCATTATNGKTQFATVKFKVKTNPTRVVVTSPENRKCSKPQKRGCIVVERLNQANITMRVRGSGGWSFDAIEICPGDAKRANTDLPCAMTPAQIAVFPILYKGASGNTFVGALNSEGVFEFPDGLALRSFNLIDRNPAPEFFFYRVKLCNGEGCVWSDPPIENKGIGTGAL